MTTATASAPATTAPPRPGLAARLLLAAVRAYRWAAAGRRSPCRYYPSCSSYALEAVELHGAVRGGWLTLRRLGRCQPWGGHGIDLVPPRRGHGHGDEPCPAASPAADRKVL